MGDKLFFKSFILGEWMTNAYLVGLPDEKRGWVFDPGFSPEPLIDLLNSDGWNLEKVIFTHAHLDHIAGADELLRIYPEAEVLIHEEEFSYPQDPKLNLSIMAGRNILGPKPDRGLLDNEIIGEDLLSCKVIHTPGHSPGGACFYFEDEGFLIAGDTLFNGSVGRYDFPTSDGENLFKSIRNKILPLPDNTRVFPGHGSETTIGQERKTNPFI